MGERKQPGVVLRAGAIVSTITLLSRLFGLIRDSLLAVLFGATHTSDAFFIALKVPNLFRRTVAEGSMGTAAVPLLTRAKERGEQEFRLTLGAILACALPIAAVLSLIGIFYSRELTLLLSPGLGTEEELILTSQSLLEILSPFVVIISITAILGSALNALHRYATPALPSALTNLFVIGALSFYFLGDHLTPDIHIVAWAFLIGSLAALIPILFQLTNLNLSPRFSSHSFGRELRGFIPLFAPALFASSTHQLLSIMLSLIASMLPVGTISCLYYADRIYQFPLGVFSVALATAALPRLTELRAIPQEFNRELNQLLRWILIIVLPATVGLYVLASPIVRLIYEHGTFSSEDAALTASALRGYSLGLLPISFQVILVRAYLARGFSQIPALSTLATLFVTPLIAFALMGHPSSQAGNALALALITFQGRFELLSLGQFGIALSTGVGMLLAVLFLFAFLKRCGITLQYRFLFVTFLKSLGAALVMGFALHLLQNQLSHLTTIVLLGVPLGIFVFGSCALVLSLVSLKELSSLRGGASPHGE